MTTLAQEEQGPGSRTRMGMACAWDRPTAVGLSIKGVLGAAMSSSGSQAFPVLGSDESRWYVKAPNNPQGALVLLTEYLMSQVGALIGAPVCDVRPIAIPEELAGVQIENGPLLAVGIGSASREIPDAVEIRPKMLHRESDDNTRRHAGVFAFYDWCCGDDPQWLVVETEDQRLYSHDHGFYLPPPGTNWTLDSLGAGTHIPHPVPDDPGDGLDDAELKRLAIALGRLTAKQIDPILVRVPASWPATDEELVGVRDYLLARAPEVAARLDELRAKLRTS